MTHWLDMVMTLLQANTSDLRELARLAGADPKTFYKGIEIRRLDLAGQDIEGMEFSTSPETYVPVGTQLALDLEFGGSEGHLLYKVRGAPRQEERAAMILAAFLQDRNSTMRAIRSYLDKAVLTNSVVNLLIDIWDQETEGRVFTDLQIARRVSGRFAKSEDKRHVLTYFLAKHLGAHPTIRIWLGKKAVYKMPKEAQTEFGKFLAQPVQE
jgi:hypothetical protein